MASPIDIDTMPLDQVEALAYKLLAHRLPGQEGPWFMVIALDCIALGVVSQQYLGWWMYSRQTEKPVRRWLSHWLMFASLAFTVGLIANGMKRFIYDFGHWTTWLKLDWARWWPLQIWLTSAPVQLFYAERSFRLNHRNYFILGLLVSLIFAALGMIIWLNVAWSRYSSYLQVADTAKQGQAWTILTLIADLVITGTVGWGLHQARTGWTSTNALLRKLMIITVETQLAPTLVTLAFFIQVTVATTNGISSLFELSLPKIYVIGYFATLNSRYTLLRQLNAGSIGNIGNPYDNMYISGSGRLHQATVHVESETQVQSFSVPEQPKGLNRQSADGDVESKQVMADEHNPTLNISSIRPTDRSSLV
ncbi:hypothetical protein IAU60_003464 [Kwoniella sp. DSM 27419]